jgi:hypothetical protein
MLMIKTRILLFLFLALFSLSSCSSIEIPESSAAAEIGPSTASEPEISASPPVYDPKPPVSDTPEPLQPPSPPFEEPIVILPNPFPSKEDCLEFLEALKNCFSTGEYQAFIDAYPCPVWITII